MYCIFLIHASVDGHLGCFLVLAIVNSAAVNIGVHISFQIMVFSSMPRSGIAGSHGQVTPVSLPGKSHRQRTLVGYSPWGHKESDRSEQLSVHTRKHTNTQSSLQSLDHLGCHSAYTEPPPQFHLYANFLISSAVYEMASKHSLLLKTDQSYCN